MLSFIIPLKCKAVSGNWSLVSELARRTVASALNQTCGDCRVVLVCHDVPDWTGDFRDCVVIKASFPPPWPLPDTFEKSFFMMQTDKGRKVLLGMEYCRSVGGGHVMVLDADDWVSNRLAGLVADHSNSNGWYFERGYRRDESLPMLVFPRRKFYHECGSSFILHCGRMPFPETLDFTKDMNDWFIRRYEVHAYVPACMAERGFPLEELPFPGTIYNFHTQNIFATKVRQETFVRKILRVIVKGRYFSPGMKREFGYCDPRRVEQ